MNIKRLYPNHNMNTLIVVSGYINGHFSENPVLQSNPNLPASANLSAG